MAKILDWNRYIEKAVQTVAEGIILLQNRDNALPLDVSEEIALFGRIQLHYYKSGTGSGGMVNVSKVTGLVEGLIEAGVKLNEELLSVYKKWDDENPFNPGAGWGTEPWSQEEMPLEDEFVKKISSQCSTAVIVIGRTAGEEQDNREEPGAYLLSDTEKNMITKVRANFRKMIVLLNTGGIMDTLFIESCNPDALAMIWQGGMTGGTGTAAVLTGKISPSGKLPDTIAYKISDYPSDRNFGDTVRNFYAEDIYVGYRYFETFAKESVHYPFGYGLSYTTFDVNVTNSSDNFVEVKVKNTGDFSGKEVVQIYCEAPQGQLGKAARVLCGFKKTRELKPGEDEIIRIDFSLSDIASYDDSGATGNRFCFVLEAGDYNIYTGTDIRNAVFTETINIPQTVVTEKLTQCLAPVMPFKRIKPLKDSEGNFTVTEEDVPLLENDEQKKRLADIPEEIPYTGDCGIKLADVLDGKNTMDEFIAQLSDYDLSCIIRGEGMGSPKVTAGTASAFGGVSENLKNFGIPCGCCADGPSGMRLDCGIKAFSLPIGSMIASTFNPELVTELFEMTGAELAQTKVDCLLGPGMNIHRHPLNGRNFEYFSEDPLLTGKMACAELIGMHRSGSEGTIKHFCGNNQETKRLETDSVISERALREIYLKGFEMAVKQADAGSVMTTYGSVNGLWTAGSYDLTTSILRKEWGFEGMVMTDWWADINERGCRQRKNNFAAMAMAQNDVYMVCSDSEKNDDNTLEYLEKGILKRSELQRNAANICRFLMNSNAMKYFTDRYEPFEVINRPEEDKGSDAPVVLYELDKELEIPLDMVCTDRGCVYCYELTITTPGCYKISLSAHSDQGEVAQIPVTYFNNGTVCTSFTFSGTNGRTVVMDRDVCMYSRFNTIRFYFAQSGLRMESIKYKYVRPLD
ncbi:MAG: glycoside hydrolase family 3 N-terminal domain-containing protein [Oscillospiraceae bacterium]|nr:glycoside hydrolase family 3 N-terminal domain-containing protein [Oscillospiraceae bacterium]